MLTSSLVRAATVADGPKFWGVHEDLAGFTEFIREYLDRHDRWLSPLYLAGESSPGGYSHSDTTLYI
jgi:carboxypeptidase C (cathepsin A)